MNEKTSQLASKIISPTYVAQGLQSIRSRENNIRILLEQGKCPADGWDEATIELLLQQLSMMDSNNFPSNCGVGEREARFASALVQKRHFRMGHGIGRSGDINEVQPKAAGCSLLHKLSNSMLLDIIRSAGGSKVASCFLVPMATGMSLTLCMLTLRHKRPSSARYVLWPRIDQKSCFKCILTAGFVPVVIEERLVGDELQTDVDELRRQIELLGAEQLVCVLSTTTCFAPRGPDNLPEIARLCLEYGVPHVVNNAYGLQSSKCMHLIEEAARVGRLDVFVQSTDKNLMVPVGGSVIAGYDKGFLKEVGQMYPGRASGSPSMDVFITLLTLGIKGYRRLLSERKETFAYLKCGLKAIAEKNDERLLESPTNHVSLAMSVSDDVSPSKSKNVTLLGSMLFQRNVSGTRVVPRGDVKTIGDHNFVGYGSHTDSYPCSYLTAAAVVGTTKQDVDVFLGRLDKVLRKWKASNGADLNGTDESSVVSR